MLAFTTLRTGLFVALAILPTTLGFAVDMDAMASASGSRYKDAKAVIFDVDGTLADSGKLGFDATQVVLKNNGIPEITYEIYCDHTRYTTPDRLARHCGLKPEDEDFERIGHKLGQEFDNLYIDLVNLETAAFYPGMLKLVRDIPDQVGVGALTNAANRYAHAVLRANDDKENPWLYEKFGSILGADNVPKPKPNRDGLLQAMSELNLPLTACPRVIYIGDSPSDGMAAKAAGMISIGVTWGAHSAEKLEPHFSHICSTVEELRCLLPLNE